MDLFKQLTAKARKDKKTIILPESYDERVLTAVENIIRKKLANIILIRTNKDIPINSSKDITVIDINFSSQFADEYLRIRRKKNPKLSDEEGKKELKDPLTFSCMLLKHNFADSVVAGCVHSTSDVLRNAIIIIGLPKNNKTVSSFFLFTFSKEHPLNNRVFAYADSAVVPNPTTEQLSDIAIQTSANYKKLTGIQPRATFLSFSTKGSAKDESVNKVIAAYKLTKKRVPKLICDGELQFDTAFVPEVAKRKNPSGTIKGDSNVFIFPDLNSGNIAYKITERIGGAIATGPIVQGLAKPVMDLSRGCTANDIVNMVIVASRF